MVVSAPLEVFFPAGQISQVMPSLLNVPPRHGPHLGRPSTGAISFRGHRVQEAFKFNESVYWPAGHFSQGFWNVQDTPVVASGSAPFKELPGSQHKIRFGWLVGSTTRAACLFQLGLHHVPWLNALLSSNMLAKVVTWDTSHLDTSRLNLDA